MLCPLGDDAILGERPIHNSVDASGQFAFVAYNAPANLTMHAINPDGSLASELAQPLAATLLGCAA